MRDFLDGALSAPDRLVVALRLYSFAVLYYQQSAPGPRKNLRENQRSAF